SAESTAERRVVFYPPLPTVALDPLNSQDTLEEKVVLTGTGQADTPDPFSLLFRVWNSEGEVKSFTPQIDRNAGTWKVELALFPGSNAIEAVAANKWHAPRVVTGSLTLHYRRPPRIIPGSLPKEVPAVETNKVRLAVTVECPTDRPLEAIR